jgi:large subunit ribosomal protein L10
MPLTKEQKSKHISEITDIIDKAKSLVFVKFKGISVSQTSAMRKKLVKEELGYRVIKKTLLQRALDIHQIRGEAPKMEGEVAVAYGADALLPAKAIKAHCRELKGALVMLGGVYEGVYKNASEMDKIASIPSRETLLAQIAYLMNSPIQRLAIAMNEIAKIKSF